MTKQQSCNHFSSSIFKIPSCRVQSPHSKRFHEDPYPDSDPAFFSLSPRLPASLQPLHYRQHGGKRFKFGAQEVTIVPFSAVEEPTRCERSSLLPDLCTVNIYFILFHYLGGEDGRDPFICKIDLRTPKQRLRTPQNGFK